MWDGKNGVRRALGGLIALLAALVVTACGGGGGGGSDATPVVPLPLAAPTINAQPVDALATAGSAVRFAVGVNESDVSYQWQRSNDNGSTWVAIAGATTASYTLAETALADNAARLRVVVSRGTAQTLSSVVTLTVNAQVLAPTITVQPQAVQVTAGANASFAVTATGSTLAYRWQTSGNGSDWTDADGGSAATLVLVAVPSTRDQLQLRVVVSNTAGSVTSSVVRLTVNAAAAAPAFSIQPQSASVVAPNAATFSVVVGGSPAPSLQWQRSSDGGASFAAIAGATGASYTTPATSVADSGTRYRVVATNASGAVNSAAVVLTVTAAPAAPAFSSQPADAAVLAGQTANFSAAATGTPVPTLQWQVSTDGGITWANINNATGSSYTLAATLADNGRRLRVVASNSQGTLNSRAAVLTVTAPASPLNGRNWTAGQQAATGTLILGGTATVSGIDDQGRSFTLFSKVVGDRLSLHAVRGEPAATGAAPLYGPAVPLEAGYVGDPATGLVLAVSRAGQAVAMWNHLLPCTSTSSQKCTVSFVSRFVLATGTWEAAAPVTGATSPDLLSINDNGDVAVRMVQPGDPIPLAVVGWRASGQTSFSFRSWPLDLARGTFFPYGLQLDSAGRLLVAGTQTQPGSTNTDIAVVRGSVGAGLGNASEVVDLRGATATFNALFANPAGQAVLLWSQDNGTRATVYAATLDSAGGNWAVADTGEAAPASGSVIPAALSNEGDFIWYFYGRCAALRRTAGNWSATAALPAAACLTTGLTGSTALAPSGLLVALHPADGSWISYDPRLNQVVNSRTTAASGSGYLLGFGKALSFVPGTLLLASNGVGFYASVNAYDVLPTLALPNGDSRGVNSLWGWYLK